MIPLHKTYISGKEIEYIQDVIQAEALSGNGKYTQLCHTFFEREFHFKNAKLTNSCTAALHMAAILLNLKEGDEVIVPSFTYITSANPFVLHGAKIVYADSLTDSPNIDPNKIEALITEKTKAIVVMHYGGIACDMDAIMKIANSHGVFVIEDAAHSLGATYKYDYLGSIGHFAAFSFHATKNITSGHGGLLVINDKQFIDRAEIIWEKGTNRKMFLEGEVNKYEWYDVGLSFYPSELTAAFLWAQLQQLKKINEGRQKSWEYYLKILKDVPFVELPKIENNATHNAHLFYVKLPTREKRNELLKKLKAAGVSAAFHYLALHKSPFAKETHSVVLKHAEDWAAGILRLPLYYGLKEEEQDFIAEKIKEIVKHW